jgi:hypothetical protein
MESGEARKEIGRVQSMLVRYQERAGSLQRAFPNYMRRPDAMQPVDEVNGLVSYLSKEMTTQATRALDPRPSSRLRGSHRLEGDGDRVSLSRPLKNDALAARGGLFAWRTARCTDFRRGRTDTASDAGTCII